MNLQMKALHDCRGRGANQRQLLGAANSLKTPLQSLLGGRTGHSWRREDPWREAWSLPWVALRLHLEHGQGGKSWGGVGGGRVGSIALGSGIAGIGTEVQSTKAFVE